jgi:hypothetical protein
MKATGQQLEAMTSDEREERWKFPIYEPRMFSADG